MTVLDFALVTLALIGVLAVGAAVYNRFFKVLMLREEGPILVKGGSVKATADDDWVLDASGKNFELKTNNPALNFWAVVLIQDGVRGNQMNGKIVEVDIVDAGGNAAKTDKVKFLVAGGIKVNPPNNLQANGKTLTHSGAQAYMKEVRVIVQGQPKTFTFTPAESGKLEIELRPMK